MQVRKGYYPSVLAGVSLSLVMWAAVSGPRMFLFPFGLTLIVSLWIAEIAERLERGSTSRTIADDPPRPRWGRRPYEPMRSDAGRWVDAPVAELDKSTIGKLLASRASRDPGLHVVVPSNHPPACTDALYDPELDG
jgi:hypothetical protein